MNLRISPTERISGTVDLPASKSYSIRAFFVAACGGRSNIIGASDCDDAKVAKRVGQQLLGTCSANSRSEFGACPPIFDVGESGTSLRFILPLLPYFTKKAKVTGKGTLVGRPNEHLCAALRTHGLNIQGTGENESVPIIFSGMSRDPGDMCRNPRSEFGTYPQHPVCVDGSLSSQFVSALMIAAPLSGEDTRLVVTGNKFVSQEYVTMTRQILARAGICVKVKSPREFFIPGGQKFTGLKRFHVPSDLGLAAFFMSAAALTHSNVVMKGHFDDALVQSDGAIIGLLTRMGVKMQRTAKSIRIKGPCFLKGGTFSLKDCPDLVPIMAVTAMFAKGTTRLKDIGHARVKESDRISDLRKELLKAGADIEERPDELIIHPRAQYAEIKGLCLDPHHDHRLAMAFAVLGLKLGLRVKDVECTSKSYPGFVKAFKLVTHT